MTLLAMMEFIDNLSLEENLYWQVSRKDTGALVELSWQRTSSGGHWSVKTEKKPEGYQYDRHGMAAHLTAIDVDAETLTRQLGANIMTQALYADLMLAGAKKLFGESALDQGLGNARRFVENVTSGIATTKQERRPHLNLVSDAEA